MTQPYPTRFPGVTFAAIAAALTRAAGWQAEADRRAVAKGNLTERDAAFDRALAAAWQEDLTRMEAAYAQLGHISAVPAAAHAISWRHRTAGLTGKLAGLATTLPQLIARGSLLAAEAAQLTRCFEAMLAFYEDGLDWPHDPQARHALYTEVMARKAGPKPQQEMAL